jgi:hypothetical protein
MVLPILKTRFLASKHGEWIALSIKRLRSAPGVCCYDRGCRE